ncbi:MAG: hypothetical protein ACRD2D_06435 [Terriglobales bacterium]
MKVKALLAAVLATLALGAWTLAHARAADEPEIMHFSGSINDYTPVTGVGGPWEVRGEWTLDLNRATRTANFAAALNMTHSDYWVVLNPASANDDTAAGRNPHTHHIQIWNAPVTAITDGFEIQDSVLVVGNGNAATFDTACTSTPCTLKVAITGGELRRFSNISLSFGGPPTGPTGHFGSQPIHGFVNRVTAGHDHD